MDLLDVLYSRLFPAGLFLIMAGMGLSLTLADIKRVIVVPKAAATGLACQLMLLPLLALVLVETLQPAAVIAAGALVLAACPGGVTSNAYVFAGRGDVALSVTLTAVASLITVFTIPLITYLAVKHYLAAVARPELAIDSIMLSLFMLTVLPVGSGMLIRARWPAFAQRWVEPMRRLAFTVLILLIAASVVLSWETIEANLAAAGLLAGLLNLSAMSLGFALGFALRLAAPQLVAITFEVGVQNLSLVLTVVVAILKLPELAAFTLVYGLFMKLTAVAFLFVARAMLAGTALPQTAPGG